MVIGQQFAWAHLPKTAGDATALMLQAVPGLATFADPAESDDKHLPFFARETEVRGKLLVMNIRRLPAWTLSAAHHRARYGLAPDYRPLVLETPGEMTSKTDADDLLRWMTDHDRFAVQRWLRAEHLEADLMALVGELGELTPAARAAIAGIGRVNVGGYRAAPVDTFTPEQISRLYELNPRWAEIENQVYSVAPRA